jgi:leader peptidase (prepilin peptidase)/N-methyltransferase
MALPTLEELAGINAAFPWFFPGLVFVLGAMVGSFLNVCIYRIPAGRSIITPRSTCACGKPIAWYDNIPIVSWLVLRGRARCCGQKFSIRYPAVELLTATVFLLCWLQHPPARALAGMVLAALFICATFTDFDHMLIPDRFTLGAAVIGVIWSAVFPSLHDFVEGPAIADRARAVVESLQGLLIGAGLVIMIGQTAEAVLRKEAMGLADVKLVAAVGAFFGWQGAVFSVFGGAVLGTLGLAVVMLVQRLRPTPRANTGGEAPDEKLGFGSYIPFGPMLSAGAFVYFLWLHPVVDQYFAEAARVLLRDYPAY